MKTTNKILALLAVSLALAAVSNAKADGTLLSPRAQGNQVQFANPPVANPGAMLSPRDRGNQIVKTAGTNNDPNLVALGLTPDEYVIMAQYGVAPTVAATPRAKSPTSAPPYEIAPVK